MMTPFYEKFKKDKENEKHPIGSKLKSKLKALRYLGVNSEVPKCAYNFELESKPAQDNENADKSRVAGL